MSMKLRTQILTGYILIITFLVLIAGIMLIQVRSLTDKAQWVEHTQTVITKARHIEKLMVDMETGVRGFLITGDELFLAPYENGKVEYEQTLQKLKELVADNPTQLERLGTVDRKMETWHQVAASVVINAQREVREEVIDAAYLQELLSKKVGKDVLDKIRRVSTRLDAALKETGNEDARYLSLLVAKDLVDMETGERGFLITGSEEFLEPYLVAQESLAIHLEQLREKTPILHHSSIDQLKDLSVLWIEQAGKLEIAARRKMNEHTASTKYVVDLIKKGTGKAVIDSIREELAQFVEVETELLAERDQEAHRAVRTSVIAVVIGTLLAVAAGLMAMLYITRSVFQKVGGEPVEISNIAEQVANGNLNIQITQDEPSGILASLVSMLEAIASQMAIRKGNAEISEAMVSAGDIENFTSKLLMKLIEVSGSHLGAFYMRSEGGDLFDRVASLGLREDASQSFNAEEHEGEFGRAIATRSISLVRDIPADTLFTFKTTCGTATPREILTIPLLVGRNVMGVISLATLNVYSDNHREIVDQAQLGMNTAFSNLLAGLKTQHLAEELGASNRELQAQTAELEEQSAELTAQHQQVQDANRLKSEFLSNMSHELRTPLNSVLSLSQLMLENEMDIDGGENREHIEIIERNGRQLLNLINSILDLSKIEEGKMELFVSSFSVAEIVNSVGASMRPLMDAKGLSFKIDVAEMAGIQSDKEKLQQVLFNLLSNAQKFTETGEIRIQVRLAGESVVFTVRDTGCGISAEELPHIFDEFRQLDGSTTRQHGGTGLGLAISQRLIALLGGDIDVQSEFGSGTTVRVTLPRMIEGEMNEAGLNREAGSTNLQHWTPGAEPPRVLVVEDNKVAILQITRVLESVGFVVDVAVNGEEGLAKAQEHLPDGILLDLMMPKVDGFQMLEAIRSTPETQKLPVLVLTAKDVTAAERANLSYNNVQQLIQKGSLNRANLIHAVRQLIGMQEDPIAEEKPAAKSVRRVIRKKGEKVTVLIVDDHPDNMTTTKAILGKMNLEILEARNGKEAVDVAKAMRPDIILMDIQMPVMGGIEATQQIRADETLKDTVSKPIEPATLMVTIQKWIKGENAS